jgi:group II intron reverse transcriptase/maturase
MPAPAPPHADAVSSSFEDFFSIEALQRDYARLLRSKFDFVAHDSYLPAGADRLDRQRFERQLDQHLRAIHRKVLQNRWTFSPFLEKAIPKIGGGERIISLATIRDTLVQRALYEYLYPLIDPRLDASCIAYRRGRGAHNAVRMIRAALDTGLVHVLDADIIGFFDNVAHDILLEKLESLPIDPRAFRLIATYARTPRVKAEDRDLADQARPPSAYLRTARSRGLPQGGVLSGILANLFLVPLDREMQQGANVHVRYADDFVVCCPTVSEAQSARDRAEAILKAIDLELHPDKTRLIDANDGIEFVGFSLRPGRTSVRGTNIGKFKSRIRSVIDTHTARYAAAEDLRLLVRRLKYKIVGPAEELLEHHLAKHPFRRSWIGYYRVIDDDRQIKKLDNWILRQVSLYAWNSHHRKFTAQDIRAAGLPSLFGTMWKARKPTE